MTCVHPLAHIPRSAVAISPARHASLYGYHHHYQAIKHPPIQYIRAVSILDLARAIARRNLPQTFALRFTSCLTRARANTRLSGSPRDTLHSASSFIFTDHIPGRRPTTLIPGQAEGLQVTLTTYTPLYPYHSPPGKFSLPCNITRYRRRPSAEHCLVDFLCVLPLPPTTLQLRRDSFFAIEATDQQYIATNSSVTLTRPSSSCNPLTGC